jgi:hypothetical protein
MTPLVVDLRPRQRGIRYLRRINYPSHSSLTMTYSCTEEPNWIRIIDGEGKNVGVCAVACSSHCAAPKPCSIGQRCTWGVEGGLGDRMNWCVELKFNSRSNICGNRVWQECNCIVLANRYCLHSLSGGSCRGCGRCRACAGTSRGSSPVLCESPWNQRE